MRKPTLLVCLFTLMAFSAVAETPDHKKNVARRGVEEILSQGKFELADELYAKDFVNHGGSRDYTLAEDQAAARGWREAAPDLKMTVEKLLVDGDFVTVLWNGEGTNTGTGNGLPATGKRLHVRGITIWRITDGKIREEWSQFDEARILLQLGLLVPAAK